MNIVNFLPLAWVALSMSFSKTSRKAPMKGKSYQTGSFTKSIFNLPWYLQYYQARWTIPWGTSLACQDWGVWGIWPIMEQFHRGTYTSHGSIKKGNRHSEILLRDVEVSFNSSALWSAWANNIFKQIATLASLYKLKRNDYVYPKQTIDESWEKVLLNQCEPFLLLSCPFRHLIYFVVHDGMLQL